MSETSVTGGPQLMMMSLEDMPNFIHADQVGFVRGRSSSNLSRLLYLMWLRRENNTPIAAFWCRWWSVVLGTYCLQSFCFGNGFLNWIRGMYADLQASVFMNGLISRCHSAFTLYNEPSRSDIGVGAKRKEHKLFL